MNFQFTLLRYTPDLVKGEFINLGVAILDESSGFLAARMSGESEMRRLRVFHPDADLDLLEKAGRAWSDGQMPWSELEKWRETLSDSLIVTEPKAVIAEAWQEELDVLYKRYIAAPPRSKEERAPNPRGELRQRLHDRLLIAGLLDRLHPFPVDRYTVPGDSFKIDYAYVPATNGRRKFLHAVTIDRAMPQATRLAFAFERISKVNRSDRMTALFDDRASQEGSTPIRGLLESAGITVRPYSQIDELVREIRSDLAV